MTDSDGYHILAAGPAPPEDLLPAAVSRGRHHRGPYVCPLDVALPSPLDQDSTGGCRVLVTGRPLSDQGGGSYCDNTRLGTFTLRRLLFLLLYLKATFPFFKKTSLTYFRVKLSCVCLMFAYRKKSNEKSHLRIIMGHLRLTMGYL